MQPRGYIYRNLRTNTFSHRFRNKVVDHPTEVFLKDVRYSVSQAGRLKVLREQRKNVHATVNGYITKAPSSFKVLGEITYNPYIHTSFMFNNKPILTSELVYCKNNKIYLIKET